MSRRTLPQSVRLSAAASVVACTAGLASESADAAPVWIDAPHLEGTYQPTGGSIDYDVRTVDFNQDGQLDFHIYYYINFFNLDGPSAFPETVSSTSNIFFNTATDFLDSGRWFVDPTAFANRDDVYSQALVDTPLPRPLQYIRAEEIENEFATRSFFGGTFQDVNGDTYVGYLELEVFDEDDFSTASLTIYDAGYALIPEPSSLALLGLGGLLLSRRRRG